MRGNQVVPPCISNGLAALSGHHRKVAQNYAATTSVNTSNTENYLVQQWINDFVQVTCWCHLRNFTMVAELSSSEETFFSMKTW